MFFLKNGEAWTGPANNYAKKTTKTLINYLSI